MIQQFKLYRLYCATLFGVVFAAHSLAWGAEIAVVDVQRVVNESILGKAARNNVDAAVKTGTVKLETMKKEMQSLQEGLAKQSSVLSGTALQEKQDSLQKKQRALEEAYQDQQKTLARKNEQEIGKVVSKVDTVVKQLAKEGGYAFVLEKDPRVVVYAGPEIDITKKVIAVLDEEEAG